MHLILNVRILGTSSPKIARVDFERNTVLRWKEMQTVREVRHHVWIYMTMQRIQLRRHDGLMLCGVQLLYFDDLIIPVPWYKYVKRWWRLQYRIYRSIFSVCQFVLQPIKFAATGYLIIQNKLILKLAAKYSG